MAAAAQCGGAKAVPALVKALGDSSWEVRHSAVRALGVLEDVSAVEGLCRVLKDSDHDVRESAAHALGRIGDARAIYSLVLALVDPENSVRRMAEGALLQIDRNWDQTPATRRAMPELTAALESQEYWVRHSASKVLERLKLAQPEEKPKAAAMPAPEPAPLVAPLPAGKVPAASAGINATGPQRDATLLILTGMLQDPNPYLRLAATEALGRLRNQEAALSPA
jgi:HEAT repeat protein